MKEHFAALVYYFVVSKCLQETKEKSIDNSLHVKLLNIYF